jgi:hypothetical protein
MLITPHPKVFRRIIRGNIYVKFFNFVGMQTTLKINMKTWSTIILSCFLINVALCQEDISQSVKIGDNYGGGIVFFIDPSGQSALIAAPYDQSTGMQWGCWGNMIEATGLTDGESNTIKIVKSCGENTAAYICDTLTIGGYHDWYLPSQYELNLMYEQALKIKNLSSGVYCSSTEYTQKYDDENCYVQDFGKMGRRFFWDKNRRYYVRAIRNTASEFSPETVLHPGKIPPPEKSYEEKLIDSFGFGAKIKESSYSTIDEIKIGDVVKFTSPYGDVIIGIVFELSTKNKISIITYPSPGTKLVVEQNWKNVTKLEKE